MNDAIVYCDDSQPGYTRKKARHGWAYFDQAGERITDRDEIDRLNAVGLPPAYRDAWFCPNRNGHIQAVGWDEKGRKQYRYHADFRAAQEAAKYERCAPFGRALPRLRKQVERDLQRRRHDKRHTVAAIVRLLDTEHLRIGNESYVKENKSFGLTTLRDRHARYERGTLKLKYRAKSGKERTLSITDRSLAQFVKKCQDLPGQKLFQYVGDDGEPHPVTSGDVNDYIREAMGENFTAKHFRTWGATLIAFEALAKAERDLSLKVLLEPVVAKLGNTPSVARKSYVHPSVIALVKKGQSAFRRGLKLPRKAQYLSREERALIDFLERGGIVDDQEAADALKQAA
jgi:DNA topoisomerase I